MYFMPLGSLTSFCIFMTGHSISSSEPNRHFTSERIHLLVTAVSLVPVNHRYSCLVLVFERQSDREMPAEGLRV